MKAICSKSGTYKFFKKVDLGEFRPGVINLIRGDFVTIEKLDEEISFIFPEDIKLTHSLIVDERKFYLTDQEVSSFFKKVIEPYYQIEIFDTKNEVNLFLLKIGDNLKDVKFTENKILVIYKTNGVIE